MRHPFRLMVPVAVASANLLLAGCASFKDLQAGYLSSIASANAGLGELSAAFSAIDCNRDDRLTSTELSAFRIGRPAHSAGDADFRRADTNGNGSLDREEFLSAFKPVYETMAYGRCNAR
jgi:outer membrane murein-binding lipoprotein Lpp